MKKFVLSAIALSLATPAFAQNSDLDKTIQKGQSFLRNKVFTNPATEQSNNRVLLQGAGALALTLGLSRLHSSNVRIQAESLATLEKAGADKLMADTMVEIHKAELAPLEIKATFLTEYSKNPAAALSNMESSLNATLKTVSNELAQLRNDAAVLAEMLGKQMQEGRKVNEEVSKSIVTQSEKIRELIEKEKAMMSEIAEVKASRAAGNSIPKTILGSGDIISLSSGIDLARANLVRSQEQAMMAARELEVAKQATALTVGKAVRKTVYAVGIVADVLIVADMAGSAYVINTLERDPGLSSIDTLASNPEVQKRVRAILTESSITKRSEPTKFIH